MQTQAQVGEWLVPEVITSVRDGQNQNQCSLNFEQQPMFSLVFAREMILKLHEEQRNNYEAGKKPAAIPLNKSTTRKYSVMQSLKMEP